MEPLSLDLLKTLDFATAVTAEAQAVRSWLPAEPGWSRLEAQKEAIATLLRARLAKGYLPHRELVSNMRKSSFGVRPLAVWSPLDRIVYRALTERVLLTQPPLDQSGAAYQGFINAPVRAAMDTATRPTTFGWDLSDTTIRYVVKADITAFYQYVDHSILSEQLLLVSNDYEQIDALVDLLGEVQGRAYGLPQMLPSSDRLADVYIRAVERKLTRAGWSTARYNDDFRIACPTYADALQAIEQFAVASRDAGLVINEHKTSTVHLASYVILDTPHEVNDGGDGQQLIDPGMSPDEFLSDYTDAVSADDNPDDAVEIVRAARIGDRGRAGSQALDTASAAINVSAPSAAEVRKLRRALNKLARLGVADVVQSMPLIIGYIPNLTPNVARYIAQLPAATQGISDVIDELVGQALNSWQEVWILNVIRRRVELGDPITTAQSSWVLTVGRDSTDQVAKAEAALTAAVASLTDERVAEAGLNVAPGAVAAWYLLALDATTQPDSPLRKAVAASDPLYGWLLTEPQGQH